MKAHNNGCFFSVTISRDDIERFKNSWPCSGLPSGPIWAQFDKRNGDLVDLYGSDDCDGLNALIQDGQNYAAKRLKLPEVCFRR